MKTQAELQAIVDDMVKAFQQILELRSHGFEWESDDIYDAKYIAEQALKDYEKAKREL